MVSHIALGTTRTANPGDRIAQEPQSIGDKAKQVAVDKYDITGAHIKVPAYFIVQYPNGDTKALHHVRDAKFISDVIRQIHFEQEHLMLSGKGVPGTNPNGLLVVLGISILALLLMTTTIVIGVF